MFLSYAREDSDFVEHQLTRALVTLGKDVWIDVEDIRRGASDWRAGVWAGIESATVMVFVLTPDSLASTVCGEELERADELNKRIIPVLRRSVDGLPVPPALERPNWILARPEDDFEASVTSLVEALELDEEWVERHARLAQRTGEWLRQDRDGSYLLRGSDLSNAERWLDDAGAHQEAPTAEQITYITASRRASARRQRGLLTGVAAALVVTAALAIVALALRERAIDREETALAQARAAQSIEALSRDPEESIQAALEAVAIRADEPEALFALRRAVSTAGWTRILRVQESSGAGLPDVEFSEDGRRVATAGADGRVGVWDTRTGRRITLVAHPKSVNSVQFTPDGRQLLTASRDGTARTWDSSTGKQLHVFDTKSDDAWAATYGADGRRVLTVSRRAAGIWDAASGKRLQQLAIKGESPGHDPAQPRRTARTHVGQRRECVAVGRCHRQADRRAPTRRPGSAHVLAVQRRCPADRDVLCEWRLLRVGPGPRGPALLPARQPVVRRRSQPRRTACSPDRRGQHSGGVGRGLEAPNGVAERRSGELGPVRPQR